jgi:outer membrane protein assembly factor BamA
MAALLLWACSETKYVPKGDYLYKGTSVKVRGKETKAKEQKVLSEELETIMRPRPNREFLGVPFGLLIYNFWGKPGEEKGLGNWIARKLGEPPVLLSTVQTNYQRELVINRLENRGYFHTVLESDSTIHGEKIKFEFTADPGKQFLIDSVHWPYDSSVLSKEIRFISDKTFLEKGEPFDLDVIKAERERIDARLKEQGFYYFSPDHLLILADTTEKKDSVVLSITVKRNTPRIAQERYTIRNIYIYPRHSLKDTAIVGDTVTHKGFVMIDPEKTFRPKLFDQVMAFVPGDVYNRADHNRSLNRLIDLGVFKYVENKFLDAGNSRLDAYYFLTPFQKKSLRLELQGRNTSTNFTGGEINLSWQNRNAFKAAENVKINVYAGTDFQISGTNKGNNLYRFGSEINFNIPRFITPFNVKDPSAFIPRTRFGIGYDRLNRVNSYVLNSFRASFGYRWKESIKKEHEFTVYAVNYIQPSNISEEYMLRVMDDPTLANAIQKQFTLGPSYNYNYTNTMEAWKHTFYYNGNIDLSGNIPGLLMGASYSDGDIKEIFNAEFSQYVKSDHDFRYYNNLGRGSSFAMRVFAGAGYPYGNSHTLPFIKQYYAGGSTGLRAFRARSLGPGSFITQNLGDPNVIVADQTADIKLEANFEYRPKISGFLKGAVFVDVGNVWLMREDPERPGAKFEGDFIRELAVGAGVGLRFDISFFVLRGDLAMPLRKPWYPADNRWVIDEIAFGSPGWRRENLVFNLAIGYPF